MPVGSESVGFAPVSGYGWVLDPTSPIWQSANSDPTTATSDTSMAVTAPTGIQVGDLLVAFGGCTTTRTIAAPSGSWTVFGNDTDGTNRVYVWTKVADAGDAAASTFTFTASGTFNNAVVSVHRVTGAGNATPVAAYSTGANSQTQTCPTVTTPSNNCLMFWGCYAPANTSSTASFGNERVDNGNSTSGCWMSQYTLNQIAAGSTPGSVITTGAFGAKRVWSLAIPSANVASGRLSRTGPLEGLGGVGQMCFNPSLSGM